MHDVGIWLCNFIHTGVLDVLTSFFWFKSAFIREDLPTLVLPIKATCWYKIYFGIQWHATGVIIHTPWVIRHQTTPMKKKKKLNLHKKFLLS